VNKNIILVTILLTYMQWWLNTHLYITDSVGSNSDFTQIKTFTDVTIFWDVTSYNLPHSYQCFRRTGYLLPFYPEDGARKLVHIKCWYLSAKVVTSQNTISSYSQVWEWKRLFITSYNISCSLLLQLPPWPSF
jgi:hypothetical protein